MTHSPALAEAFENICVMEAPLAERLSAYAGKLRELNFPFAEAYDDLVARLYAGEIGREAPRPGEPMPPFLLSAMTGRLVALDELILGGPVVISFNRGHWCPFCKIELKTLAEYHDAIRGYGAEIVSIMPDTQRFTRPLSESFAARLLFLSDMDNGYALSLGLVMFLGHRLQQLMKGRGYRLDEYQSNDGHCVPLPATFIVGGDGRVVARYIDSDFRRRMDPEEIVAVLRQLALERSGDLTGREGRQA